LKILNKERSMQNIPQFEPWLGEEELVQVAETIKDNWITGGPKVKEFERRVGGLCGTKHAIACCNGTLALYMGLKAMGIGEGDEVIVPDFTFIASANSVVMTGGIPVFVDIDAKTFNISPECTEKAITGRTKAIMPVHIYGQSADMDAIMEIARKHKLMVIEDAAQGIGVSFRGKPVGGFGETGCMSFYADKTLTTGEGGMVFTDDDKLAEKLLILKHQGRTGRGFYFHEHIGFNFRLTDMQAAVGLAQLNKLPAIIERKKSNEKLYRDLLADVRGVEFPYIDPQGFNVPFRINILLDNPQALSEYLNKEGIGSRQFFYPLHLQPCYNIKGDFPNSIRAYERGLSLPSSVTLKHEQIEYVCEKIRAFVGK
jgi:perosamine synthetase